MIKYGATPSEVSTRAQGDPGDKVVKHPKPSDEKEKKDVPDRPEH